MKTQLYSIFFVVIASAILCPLDNGHACSCIEPPPPLEALAQSDAVFSGKVTVIGQNSDDFSIRFQFAVVDVWKGVTTAETQVITATNSAACGFEFQADERYLVYAYQDENGELNTNICTRTRLLEYAEDDIAALGQPILSFNVPPDDEGESTTTEDIANMLLDNFDDSDSNGDDMLDYAESQSTIPGLTQEQFDVIDTDANGYLSKDELQDVLGGNGCCKQTSGVKDNVKRFIGDWLLVGLSLMVLSSITRK